MTTGTPQKSITGGASANAAVDLNAILASLDAGSIVLFAQGFYKLTASLQLPVGVTLRIEGDDVAIDGLLDGAALELTLPEGRLAVSDTVSKLTLDNLTLLGGMTSGPMASRALISVSPASPPMTFDAANLTLRPGADAAAVSFERQLEGVRQITVAPAGSGQQVPATGPAIDLGSGFDTTILPTVYQEGQGPMALTSGLLNIRSDLSFQAATVTVTDARAGDSMAFTADAQALADLLRVQLSYDAPSGVLSITPQPGRLLNAGLVELLLEAVRFDNTTTSPGDSRQFTYTLTDKDGATLTANAILRINDVNEAPALALNAIAAGWVAGNAAAIFTQGSDAVDITTAASISLADDDGDAINTVTVRITDVADTQLESLLLRNTVEDGDLFGLSPATIAEIAGVTVAYDAATATLTLSASAALLDDNVATTSLFEYLLNEVKYANTAENPTAGGGSTTRTIEVVASDALVLNPTSSAPLTVSISLSGDDLSVINSAATAEAVIAAVNGVLPGLGAEHPLAVAWQNVTALGEFEAAKLAADVLLNRPQAGFATFGEVGEVLSLLEDVYTGLDVAFDADLFTLGAKGSSFYTLAVGESSVKLGAQGSVAFSDTTAHVAGNGAFATIANGINAAASGDTILVAAGVYAENVLVNEADLTILGPNAGTKGTGNRVAEAEITGTFRVNAAGSGATVDGVKLAPTSTSTNPILIRGADTTLTNSVITGQIEVGINGFTLTDSFIGGMGSRAGLSGVAQNALYSDQAAGGKNWTITGNTFDDFARGLTLASGGGVTYENLIVTDNVFQNFTLRAIQFGDDADVAGATITGNTFKDGSVGVGVFNRSGSVTDLVIDDNSFDNLSTGVWINAPAAAGLFVDQAENSFTDVAAAVRYQAPITSLDVGAVFGVAAVDFADVSIVFDAVAGTYQVTKDGVAVTVREIGTLSFEDGSVRVVGPGGFATIQEAVDAAAEGDTVLLAPGTYAETVHVGKDVSIIGAGKDADPTTSTIVDPVSGDGFWFGAGSAGASLQSLRITGANNAIQLENDKEVANLLFRDIAAVDSTLHGINFRNGAIGNVTIEDSLFAGNGSVGIRIPSSGTYGTVTITDSVLENNGSHGFLTLGASVANVVVTGSSFANNGTGGATGQGDLVLFSFNGDATLKNLTISGDGSGSNALQITGPTTGANPDPDPRKATNPIGTVSVENVSITGTYARDVVFIGRYRDLEGLEISGLDIAATTTWTQFNVINAGGDIDLADYGLADKGLTTSIASNNGVDFGLATATAGAILKGGSGNDALIGHTLGDTFVVTAGTDLIFGQGGDDMVIFSGALADYTVTMVDGVLTVSGGGQGTNTLVGVEAIKFSDGFAVVPGLSIQKAIDLATAGDTINVGAGTYDESVLVDKDVSLVGPNAGKTGFDAERSAEAVIGGKVTISADGASLAGFTLTKAAANTQLTSTTFLNWDMNSVLVTGDGVTVAANIIEVFGGQTGKSAFVQLSGATTFTGNVVKAGAWYDAGVDERGASAVWINADTSDAVTVSNNHLLVSTNVSVPGDADAIFLNNAGSVAITDNLMSGTDGGFVAFGNYGALAITGNTIETYAKTGLRLFESTAATKPDVIVSGNTIDASGARLAFVQEAVKLGTSGSGFPALSFAAASLPAFHAENTLAGEFGVLANGTFSLFADAADATAAAGAQGVIWDFENAQFLVFDGMSIQAAVNAATAGDTIVVDSGSYAAVNLDKGVTLVAVEGVSPTITGAGVNQGAAIRVASGVEDVSVTGFTIAAAAGDLAAVYLVADNANITFADNTITGGSAHAVLTGGGMDGVSLTGNALSGDGPLAVVYVNGPASKAPASANVSLTGNTITGGPAAGLLLGLESTGGVVQGNSFSGSASYAALELWGAGVTVGGAGPLANSFAAFSTVVVDAAGNYDVADLLANNVFVEPEIVLIRNATSGNIHNSLAVALGNAKSGETVEISAGTLDLTAEARLTVPAGVTLKGAGLEAGAPLTTLKGGLLTLADGATVDGLAFTDYAGRTGGGEAVVLVSGADATVKDSSFTVVGADDAYAVEVRVTGENATISGNTITRDAAGDVAGSSISNPAIVADGIATLAITGNTLERAIIGVVTAGSGVDLTITGNSVTPALPNNDAMFVTGPGFGNVPDGATLTISGNSFNANAAGVVPGLQLRGTATTATDFAAFATPGNDFFQGGNGDDSFAVSAGDDLLKGEEGVDTVVVGAALDFSSIGVSGTDVALTANGNDTLRGIERLSLTPPAEELAQFGSATGDGTTIIVSLVADPGFPIRLVGGPTRPDLYFDARDLPGVVAMVAQTLDDGDVTITLQGGVTYPGVIDLGVLGSEFVAGSITINRVGTGDVLVGPVFRTDPATFTLGVGVGVSNASPDLASGDEFIDTAVSETTTGAPFAPITVAEINSLFRDDDLGSTLEGIALTKIESLDGEEVVSGRWQFKTATDVSFRDVPNETGNALSESSALLLANTTELRFVPDAASDANRNFGRVPELSFVAVDSTQRTQNGSQFTTATTLLTEDVRVRGEGTAFSADIATYQRDVTPLSSPPNFNLTGVTLPQMLEDSRTEENGGFIDDEGMTVASIFETAFGDAAIDDELQGVVVVDNAAVARNGTWEYRVPIHGELGDAPVFGDWTPVGTVTPQAGLFLASNAELRFVPNWNFNGTASALTVRGVNESADLVTGAPVDASVGGLGTVFSQSTATLGIEVAGVDDIYTFGTDPSGVALPLDFSDSPASVLTFNNLPVVSLLNFDRNPSDGSRDRIDFDEEGMAVPNSLVFVNRFNNESNASANFVANNVNIAGGVTEATVSQAFSASLTAAGRSPSFNFVGFTLEGVSFGPGFGLFREQATGVTSLWWAQELNPLVAQLFNSPFEAERLGYLGGESWSLAYQLAPASNAVPTTTVNEMRQFTATDFII